MTAASVGALSGAAFAQGEAQDTIDHVSPPIAPVVATPAPALVYAQPSANDVEWVRTGVAAAHAGNLEQMRTAISSVSHPTARKLLEYLAADNMGSRMTFAELDRARVELQAWPHRANRQMWAERALEGSSLTAQQVADWYKAGPAPAAGAMALAAAYQQLGRAGGLKA